MKVQYRYEHWTRNGKEFTSWINKPGEFKTKKEANEFIKQQVKTFNKLKYEYRVVKKDA